MTIERAMLNTLLIWLAAAVQISGAIAIHETSKQNGSRTNFHHYVRFAVALFLGFAGGLSALVGIIVLAGAGRQ